MRQSWSTVAPVLTMVSAADRAAGLDDGAGHDLDAFGEGCVAGDDGRRVDDGGEMVPLVMEPLEDAGAVAGAADRADAVDEPYFLRVVPQDGFFAANDRHAEDGVRPAGGDVDEGDDVGRQALEGVDEHFGVAAGAEDDDGMVHQFPTLSSAL